MDLAFDLDGVLLNVCTRKGQTAGSFVCPNCSQKNRFDFFAAMEQELNLLCAHCGRIIYHGLDPRLRWAWEKAGGSPIER